MVVKKSARTVYRYILFDYLSQSGKRADELQRELNQVMQQMYGMVGAPHLKLISFSKGRGIVRCGRSQFVQARRAFALYINPTYRIRQVRSSGTLKGLREGL